MKYSIFIILLCAVGLSGRAQAYVSLDATDPIGWDGRNTVTYDGKTIALDSHRLFVDGRLTDTQAAQSPYVFNRLQDALETVNKATISNRSSASVGFTIYIAPYVYWIDDPDDPTVRRPQQGGTPFGFTIRTPHIQLIGLTKRAEHVVLACNRGQTQGAEGNFTMFYFDCAQIATQNLTMGNYCNVDLVYPLLPQLNRRKRSDAITQAQLAICNNSIVTCNNTRFVSRLNLCNFAGAGRGTRFVNCHLECTDDALATGIYSHCDFDLYSSKPFYSTSGYGAIMIDCDLNILHNSPQYLTKAGGQVTLVNCRWHAAPDYSQPVGWTQDPTPNLICYQSNVTLNGKPITMQPYYPQSTVDITEKPILKLYAPENRNLYPQIPAALFVTPARAEIETPASMTLSAKALFLVETSADVNIRWTTDSSAPVKMSGTTGSSITVTGTNDSEIPHQVVVRAQTPDGLEAAATLHVLPSFLPPPHFIRQPTLTPVQDEGLELDYLLDLKGRADQSLITWYRCLSPHDPHPVAVAVSRHDEPLKTYTLSAADAGYYIMASIQPKHLRSKPGEAVSVMTKKAITWKAAKSIKQLNVDFSHFPTAWQPRIIAGGWTADTHKPNDLTPYPWQPTADKDAWYYGTGPDGMRGHTGLVQAERGARLLYTPLEKRYGDMSIDLTVATGKTAGQGFGSATGQYLEVYIKYDTHTQTGYGLRIERVPEYSNAVAVCLMSYKQGVGTPITVLKRTTAFRTGCRMRLNAKHNVLEMLIEHGADSLQLSATIQPNTYGGMGIQHTGSIGASATMLEKLDIEWQ